MLEHTQSAFEWMLLLAVVAAMGRETIRRYRGAGVCYRCGGHGSHRPDCAWKDDS